MSRAEVRERGRGVAQGWGFLEGQGWARTSCPEDSMCFEQGPKYLRDT